jgi:hypothetical protein
MGWKPMPQKFLQSPSLLVSAVDSKRMLLRIIGKGDKGHDCRAQLGSERHYTGIPDILLKSQTVNGVRGTLT